MPSTIPYDPSLTLASIVSYEALNNIEEISKIQGPVDAAQDALNDLIMSKRSLDMTKTEIKNLGVDTATLDAELIKLNESIGKAAASYATAKIAAEPQIATLKAKIRTVHASMESPVDYLKTAIKDLPLAADTMNMDVQFFSYDGNSQNASVFSNQIASYVSGSTGALLGPSISGKVAAAAETQVLRQVTNHKIEGTLVLSVSCTHKNAIVLAPFVLQIDKAIKVWNHLFPSKQLDPTNSAAMQKLLASKENENEKFSIISGTTFGSSFVGMVHILNDSNTTVNDTMGSGALSVQSTITENLVISKQEGKIGLDEKFAGDIKNLLSTQNVTSHVTLLSMGVIPSMVANSVDRTVEKFVTFDPQSNMGQVNAIQAQTVSDRSSVESLAEDARTGEQSTEVQGKAIGSSLSALAVIDGDKNKVLDTNSMMTALQDYLKIASEGKCGVPINYYLKDIDRKMLAEMWVAKYFPKKFMAIQFDDSAAGAGASTGSGAADASGGQQGGDGQAQANL